MLLHPNGRASSAWGRGTWSVTGERTIELFLCQLLKLTFDSASEPTKFEFTPGGALARMRGAIAPGGNRKGSIDPRFASASARSPKWQDGDETRPAVARLMGTGPWAWAGITTMAFLGGGVLVTPWGQGTYHPDPANEDAAVLTFAGNDHVVTVDACHKFVSYRATDQQRVEGWVQLGQAAKNCPRFE